jgi:uncharacterized membrane protein
VIVRASNRLPAIDVARGSALSAMFAYHLVWDFTFFGLVARDIATAPISRFLAHLIASTFLLLVGISLTLAARYAPRRAFWQRLGRIALAAATISVVTRFVFRDEFVYFGILHCIALSSLLALPLRRAPTSLLFALAAAAFLLPYLFSSSFFDAPYWLWLGLSANVPASVDYQPLLPGFGMVLIGLCLGRLIAARPAPWMQRPVSGPISTALAFGGRHSLLIYLLHQPVFFLLLFGAVDLFGSNAASVEAGFINACQTECQAARAALPKANRPATCAESCSCVVRALKEADLWQAASTGKTTSDTNDRVRAISSECSRNP